MNTNEINSKVNDATNAIKGLLNSHNGSWIGTFGELQSKISITPDAKSLSHFIRKNIEILNCMGMDVGFKKTNKGMVVSLETQTNQDEELNTNSQSVSRKKHLGEMFEAEIVSKLESSFLFTILNGDIALRVSRITEERIPVNVAMLHGLINNLGFDGTISDEKVENIFNKLRVNLYTSFVKRCVYKAI